MDIHCRSIEFDLTPDQHVYENALEFVKLPDWFDSLDSYEQRLFWIRKCPCAAKVNCMVCGEPCQPPVGDVDMSGLPCQPFSACGSQLKWDDKLTNVHLVWQLGRIITVCFIVHAGDI